ncbi:MAG: hypothetical protein LBL61_06240 [Elusimicrobiota bacterium]|jgi:DNA-binding XRE family transcriptional regulator|nr:hypothetical protein [Elusimicrobiota bacterium]
MLKRPTNINILAINDKLQSFNPAAVAKALALRVKQRRLELNLTQEALANKITWVKEWIKLEQQAKEQRNGL